MGNLSYELKVDVDINTYIHAFVIHTVTHVACTASISDLLYKPIKAGNILYYQNHVIFCYVLKIYLLKSIMEYIITLLNSTYQ